MKRVLAVMIASLALVAAVPTVATEETAGVAANVTADSTISVPESVQPFVELLTDGAAQTYVEIPRDGYVTATVPVSGSAGLVLKWKELPASYVLAVRDASGQNISEETVTPAFLNMFHTLPEAATAVTVSMEESFCLSELTVYGSGELPADVQVWETPAGAPDVLIVAAYPGHVLECFGGLYPQLLADGVKTDVLYVSWRTRLRAEEALTALWTMGQTRYPYCLGRTDRAANDADSLKKDWKTSVTQTALAELLSAVQPRVIVTHARAGDSERESQAAIKTAQLLEGALEETGFRPEKVYYHENGDAATVLSYTEQLWAYDGRTAEEEALALFSAWRDTRKFDRRMTADNAYVLDRTGVGADTAGGSLLENIGYTPLFTPVPSPTPTPEPTEEPTPTPTAEPAVDAMQITPVPTAEPAAAEPAAAERPSVTVLVLLGAGLFATLILLCLFGVLKRRRGASFALLMALLPLLVAGIVAGVLLGVTAMRGETVAAVTEAPTSTATPTPEPTEEPTPEPTEEPTPEPTEEPTPEPESEKWADKFSQSGEEEYAADTDNGVWTYRSDVLAIEIERHTTEEPLVWFIAHIYMRQLDTFRAAIAAPNFSGMFSMPAWQMARNNRAVLQITGDNLLNMDRELKGILIRQGKVFLTTNSKESCVAFFPETLSMKIYDKSEITAGQLLQYGVENVFSFGPILIKDGEVRDVSLHTLNRDNPRTGVGMVEPGHFVAIVVDGRQPLYSEGCELTELARMFADEGCVEAYNLDGGVSATMMLMGEQLNKHGNNKKDWDKQRNIPDALIWGYSRNVPTVDDPIGQ